MSQIPLYFHQKTSYLEEDFICSGSNEDAYNFIAQWPDWLIKIAFIYGEEKCGKSHLTHIWQQKSDAIFLDIKTFEIENLEPNRNYILENISDIEPQEKLFHLYNHVNNQGGFLLLTDNNPLSQIDFTLADLKSRLNSIPMIEIFPPDDFLLRTILIKSFSDRQLRVGNDVVEFILLRIKRSFSAINEIVIDIDKYSMQESSRITIPFIKKYINF